MTSTGEKINTRAAVQTGMSPTSLAAIEQHFPTDKRILHDDLAFRILPPSYQFFVRLTRIPVVRDWFIRMAEKQMGGVWPGILCRKRYIDEKATQAAAGEHPVDAIVNLGAGYDTRVYRLPELAAVPVWEVDHPMNITSKQANLTRVFGAVPVHVTLVPVDFVAQDVAAELQTYGYNQTSKTLYIWEAVSQYVTESSVHRLFRFLSHAAAGSQIVFTYICKDLIDGRDLYGVEKFYEQNIRKTKVWRFGFEPEGVGDFLCQYGWQIREHLGYDELADRYVKPTGRTFPAMMFERIVFAEKLSGDRKD